MDSADRRNVRCRSSGCAGTTWAMENTWDDRDYPVLEALVKHFDGGGGSVSVDELANDHAGGVDYHDVPKALGALASETPPLIILRGEQTGNRRFAFASGEANDVIGVTGHARRAVGAWPSELSPPNNPSPSAVY